MKLIFAGSGSAFYMNDFKDEKPEEWNWQSNVVLETKDGLGNVHRLLIDAGSDVRHSLSMIGLDYMDIESLYISHLHADHIGGIEWLAFVSFFDPRFRTKYGNKPILYANEQVVKNMWNNSLAGGLGSIQGQITDLDTYFDVRPQKLNDSFMFYGVELQLVQVVHIMNGYHIVPSYGLLIKYIDHVIFLTTDTQYAPEQIVDFYKQATIIFHDCETSPFPSRVHAHYNQLKQLDPGIKKKMYLYHYQKGELPNAEEDGFLGFIKRGQCFDFSGLELNVLNHDFKTNQWK